MQDGSINFEVKLTGIVATNMASPADGSNPRYGTLMLPRVVAGYHQHVFVARLDFALDNRDSGEGLIVSEVSPSEPASWVSLQGGKDSMNKALMMQLQSLLRSTPLLMHHQHHIQSHCDIDNARRQIFNQAFCFVGLSLQVTVGF